MILDEIFIESLFPNDILEKDSEYRACYRPDGTVNKFLMHYFKNHKLLKEINNQYIKDIEYDSKSFCDKTITKNLLSFCKLQYICSKFNTEKSINFQKF